MKYERELLKGNTDTILLSLLSLKPMYGYQVGKELERLSQGYFKLAEGTLYPALHRLERKGLLISQWQVMPNGQERKHYNLTEKGKQVLATKTQEWRGFSQAIDLVLQPAEA